MLGERIKEIRKKLGLKQEQFADLLNIESKTAISYWENNQRTPGDINILVTIASLGKVTLDWLLTGVESTFEPYSFLP